MLGTGNLIPLQRIDRAESRIAERLQMHVRNHQTLGSPNGLCIEIGAAYNDDLVDSPSQRVTTRGRNGGLHAPRNQHPWRSEIALATDDDIGAPGERLSDREVGPSSHYDRLANGGCAEVPQVRLQR